MIPLRGATSHTPQRQKAHSTYLASGPQNSDRTLLYVKSCHAPDTMDTQQHAHMHMGVGLTSVWCVTIKIFFLSCPLQYGIWVENSTDSILLCQACRALHKLN